MGAPGWFGPFPHLSGLFGAHPLCASQPGPLPGPGLSLEPAGRSPSASDTPARWWRLGPLFTILLHSHPASEPGTVFASVLWRREAPCLSHGHQDLDPICFHSQGQAHRPAVTSPSLPGAGERGTGAPASGPRDGSPAALTAGPAVAQLNIPG